MAKYRVLQTSFINNSLVNEGDVVDYDGEAADNLELVSKASSKGKAAEVATQDQAQAADQTVAS